VHSTTITIAVALLLLTACMPAPEALPASPSPVASPRPPLTARQTVYVGDTDRYGADFRAAPGPAAAQLRVVPEGAVLEATGREQQVDTFMWSEVRDSMGAIGWVRREFLSTAPPPLATPTLMPGMAAPTTTPGLNPVMASETPTTPTAVVRPIDTLVPIAPPGQQPALAPIPAEPTPREGLPTLPPLAPARPTNEMIDGDFGTPNTRGATAGPTRGPAATAAPAGR
jgi:hypothetical protein